MRILLVASVYPPEIGGPATFIDHLAHELTQHGHKVTVVCNAITPGREPSDAGRPFRVVRVFGRLWAVQVYKMIAILAWHMLWHDSILVNGFEFSAYWASRITRRHYAVKIVGDVAWEEARGSGVTSMDIDSFQNDDNVSGRVRRLRKWREKYLNGANEVVVPSEYLKRLVSGWGVPQQKIRVIYNGVSLPKNNGAIPRYRSEDRPLQVIFVGRLTNWKGVETLLLAVNKLEGIDVHILGDGPEYPMLKGISEQLCLSSRVKFWGSLGHETVVEFMRSMDVLVLGSSYEGLSHTLLEAFAIGLPCVASSSGGNPEIIRHAENGLLFKYGNVRSLADSLQMLRDNEDLRLKLAVNAKKDVEKFDFRNTIEGTIQLLMELR